VNDLELAGCRPEPLLSYLKALGVFRLVAEQADPDARACWRGDTFCLRTRLDQAALERFFMEEYRPTPIVAPWNSASGFRPGHRDEAISALENMDDERVATYKATIRKVREIYPPGKTGEKLTKAAKLALLSRCRAELPEPAVQWLDAVYALAADDRFFAPLLGSGGNDGNLEFSNNFLQRVAEVLLAPDEGTRSASWLRQALFAEGRPQLAEAAVGLYHPGNVGGPNATEGFESDSLVNPWDFILGIEGALMLAGSVSRRLGSDAQAKAAFPFTVTASAAGWGTVSDTEITGQHAEVWLPLWDRPASYPEIRHVFAEGRAQVGRRPRQARTGVDFARAVVQLGVDRGLRAFERYGLLSGNRSGTAHLAVPLGRLTVRAGPEAEAFLLDDAAGWLDSLRWWSRDKQAPERHRRAVRAIEDAIFSYCQRPTRSGLQAVLIALGGAERAIAVSHGAHERIRRPLQTLSPRWLCACDDGSTEFRLAAAIASIEMIRAQMEPVTLDQRPGPLTWAEDDRGVAWTGSDVCRNLSAVLWRRCVEALKQAPGEKASRLAPLGARLSASLAHVQRFLIGGLDDDRTADLIWGCALINWGAYDPREHRPARSPEAAPDLPRVYALLKLCFLSRPLKLSPTGEEVAIRPDLAMLVRLRAAEVGRAVDLASLRLRAAGLTPLATPRGGRPAAHDFLWPREDAVRLAAGLLIPVSETEKLAEMILRPSPAAVSA
jgi:CRISPR-associated protein Csx17